MEKCDKPIPPEYNKQTDSLISKEITAKNKVLKNEKMLLNNSCGINSHLKEKSPLSTMFYQSSVR